MSDLEGRAEGLLETLEIVWRVGRKEGISGKVQVRFIKDFLKKEVF